MEDNEKVEETTEKNDEELEETEAEEVEEETNEEEEDDSNIPSVEDYEKAMKELKTLKAQKEHWRKKATSKPDKKEDFNKTNVSEEDLIRTARIASKLDDDDLEMLSSLNGSLQEKLENPLFKAYKDGKAKKLKSESASLKPSSGATASKAKANMTAEEHKKWVKSLMS